jgi:hypothetical protein
MTVSRADEENRGEKLLPQSKDGGRKEMTDIDRACNSFCEVEGAGTTGAEGRLGAAQHAILQPCRQWPQHFAAGGTADAPKNGYAARANPSSNATAILLNFKAMRQCS